MSENLIKEFYILRDKIIEDRYRKLNDQQRSAVLSNDKNLAIIACPGAGKTTTLINRIDCLVTFGLIYRSEYYPEGINNEDILLLKRYLNNEKLDEKRLNYLLRGKSEKPENIVVITFTRAAALNMKKRYKSLNKSKSTPFFGTFHGLFYKILSRKYKKIDIINTSNAYKLIKGVLTIYLDEVGEEKVKEILNSISSYKTSGMNMEDFSPDIDKEIFIECYRVYEDYKNTNNLLDFDDLQIRCKELFLKNRELLNGYRKLFKYILVDEFQDCDSMQVEILKLLNDKNSVFSVGDEDQCIYGFRGSKPECIVNFEKHFKDGKKVFLSTNYRCPKSVVEISNNLIKNNKIRNEKDMKAYNHNITKVNAKSYLSEREQAEEIALNIIKLTASNSYSYEDNAILYRTNVESRSIIDSFIRKKIPFKLLDKEYNFFEHFICKDILAYLKLSIDRTDKECFSRIINKPFRYISKVNIEKVKKNAHREDCFDKLKEIDNIAIFQLKNIDNLKRDIQNLNKMSLAGAINFILKDLGYYDYLKEYSLKFKLDMSELEDIVGEFVTSAEGYNTIITFLAHVDEVGEQISKNKSGDSNNGVILSTIHGVKGMEFKNVFIINCNEDTIPHINSVDKNIEEERRLFYVGITRTIDNLWLGVSNEIRGKSKTISRFIKECKLEEIIKSQYNVGDFIIHNTFGKGKIEFVDDGRIEINFENSMHRTFDPTVLYNNGLIKKIV